MNKWFFQKNKKISWKPGGGLGTQKASLDVNKEETSHKDAFSTVQVLKHKHIFKYIFKKSSTSVLFKWEMLTPTFLDMVSSRTLTGLEFTM